MNHLTNLVRIKAVANALDELNEKVVFVGGATLSLYADRPVLDVRPTDDIDVIIEIWNYADRSALENKLRKIGFSHDVESGIVCRYKIEGIIVDIMPTDDYSVGFRNSWYPEGFAQAISYELDEQRSINILSAPYFMATKLEAFKGRGGQDGRTSTDFEDIIFVLENRETIWDEMEKSFPAIKKYLRKEFSTLLLNARLYEWIDGHVERGDPPATQRIIDSMKKFCENIQTG
jgi:predicted nucleotidyltransferase